MRLRYFTPILGLASALSFTAAACSRSDAPPDAAGTLAAVEPSEDITSLPDDSVASAPAPESSTPLSAATGLPPSQSRDPAEVLQFWRRALETHDFATARGVWGDHGEASGRTAEAFAAAWDKYRIINITIGKGEQQGAAGSSFYEAPVTVTGLRRDGKPYHLSGTVTLRRVNDVDGATPEQLRWHIERSTLSP